MLNFKYLLRAFIETRDDKPKQGDMVESATITHRIELWKTSVNTQQHFNTLQLQLRNFALTLYLAVLTLVGYALKEHIIITVCGENLSVAALACLAGIALVLAFYYTEWGYFQLLKGAVKHGTLVENALKEFGLPEACLAKNITESSSKKRFFFIFPKGASPRLHIFYWLLIATLLFVALFCQCASFGFVAETDGAIREKNGTINSPTPTPTPNPYNIKIPLSGTINHS